MPIRISDFVFMVEKARKELNQIDSPQLYSLVRRNSLRALVEQYFKDIRPHIKRASEQDDDISNVDTLMQELLEMCHKRGLIKHYKTLLSNIRKGLIQIDSRIITSPSGGVVNQTNNEVDTLILKTLSLIVPSAAYSYQQAILDLQAEQRFSWRGPATDLREALRETLDHLAPDADVTAMPGYKQSPDTNGPTMKQKVRFVLKKRGLNMVLSAPAESATESVDLAVGTFVRSVYTRSNVSTHTPTDKTEVIRLRDFVRVVLCELLEVRT